MHVKVHGIQWQKFCQSGCRADILKKGPEQKMSNDSDSDTRCLKATELTFRFIWRNCVPLAFFLFGICVLFGMRFKLGLNVGLAIVVLYFTVAYLNFGRGNRASTIIGGLAGLAATNVAVEECSANDANDTDDADDALMFDFNPANGLPMFNDMVDIHGNALGSDSN